MFNLVHDIFLNDFDVKSDILKIDFEEVMKSNFAFLIMNKCKLFSVSTRPIVSVSTRAKLFISKRSIKIVGYQKLCCIRRPSEVSYI